MILKSEKLVFIIKGLILLIGFPNNKYTPNTKNYLRLLIGGDLVLGGKDYSTMWICYIYDMLHMLYAYVHIYVYITI